MSSERLPSPATLASALRSHVESEQEYWLSAGGMSMRPLIPPGSRVWLVPSDSRPAVGEVWAYCDAKSQVVVHRCVASRPGCSRFRGDSSPAVDPLVADGLLIGRVVAAEVDGERRPIRRERLRGHIRHLTGRHRVARLMRRAQRVGS